MVVLLRMNMIVGLLLMVEIILDRIADLNYCASSCLEGFLELLLNFAEFKDQVFVRVQKLVVTSVQKRLNRSHIIRHQRLNINL